MSQYYLLKTTTIAKFHYKEVKERTISALLRIFSLCPPNTTAKPGCPEILKIFINNLDDFQPSFAG